jgi:hypothetical protein
MPIDKARAAEIKQEIANKKDLAIKKIKDRKAIKNNPNPDYYTMPEQTGDHEADSLADLKALEEGFRKRMADENQRFALATDTEYWCCICFQSRAEKEEFLSKLDILKYGDKYLDGQQVAEKLGVSLTPVSMSYNPGKKVDKTWESFVEV